MCRRENFNVNTGSSTGAQRGHPISFYFPISWPRDITKAQRGHPDFVLLRRNITKQNKRQISTSIPRDTTKKKTNTKSPYLVATRYNSATRKTK
jgi:hypothetical protein